MSIESVMPFNHFTLGCPLLLLPSIFPSVRAFSNESALCNRWPKYWKFSFSISPSNEYSGLISFRMGWLDLFSEHLASAMGFPGGSEVKASAWNAGDPGFNPWVGKIPWRRKWQPTPVLLPGESHGGRSLIGYSPWGRICYTLGTNS